MYVPVFTICMFTTQRETHGFDVCKSRQFYVSEVFNGVCDLLLQECKPGFFDRSDESLRLMT